MKALTDEEAEYVDQHIGVKVNTLLRAMEEACKDSAMPIPDQQKLVYACADISGLMWNLARQYERRAIGDEIICLESGTEITIDAALGDLEKIVASMASDKSNDWSGEVSDLVTIGALLEVIRDGARG